MQINLVELQHKTLILCHYSRYFILSLALLLSLRTPPLSFETKTSPSARHCGYWCAADFAYFYSVSHVWFRNNFV